MVGCTDGWFGSTHSALVAPPASGLRSLKHPHTHSDHRFQTPRPLPRRRLRFATEENPAADGSSVAATLAPAAASSVVFLALMPLHPCVEGGREGGREALTFLKAHRCWVRVLGPGGPLRWHQAAPLVGGDGNEGTDLHSRHTFQLPFKWKHQRENTD